MGGSGYVVSNPGVKVGGENTCVILWKGTCLVTLIKSVRHPTVSQFSGLAHFAK